MISRIIFTLFLALLLSSITAFSQDDAVEVEKLMKENLTALHNGELETFFSLYPESYSDAKMEHPDKSDKEVLTEMITEVVSGGILDAFKGKPIEDFLVEEEKMVMSYAQAIEAGMPLTMGDFTLAEGDYIVSFLWNDKAFFKKRITRVFRKVGDKWMMVAGG